MSKNFDSLRCQECKRHLHREALYVETTELSERLGVSDDSDAINLSGKLRAEVLRLYGRECFSCGSESDLGIDHIQPRSEGGKASFF
jgi:hypothetical protein